MAPSPILFDYALIERQLCDLGEVHPRFADGGDLLDETVIAHMLAGYRLVERLVAASIDAYAMGNLHWLLKLNAVVLCGLDVAQRRPFTAHLEATSDRFYNEPDACVRELVDWIEDHSGDPLFERAAGIYARPVCHPQLFIEGNHRTACLMASLKLCVAGQPPFVMSPRTFAPLMAVTKKIDLLDKRALGNAYRMAPIIAELADVMAADIRLVDR